MNKIAVQTIWGFITLMLILGICMFLPAGSFNFWQAWVYLAVWAACVIPITLYLFKHDLKLLTSRLSVGPTAETQANQKIIQSLASLFFIGLFIVPGLDFRFQWSNVPVALQIISDVMIALGFYIVFLVFKENTYTSAVIEVADEQTVISSGPYRFVRHPMYAGALLLLAFTPFALGSFVALPFFLPMVFVIAARLLSEEKFLNENLKGYKEYCAKMRYHLIPYVW
jgi:protein-S-isoprenylcysteine O-methyltransferase Ste14